jgi:hypothetical protein
MLNSIKKEYKDVNKNFYLFYKGNRVHENDTIYSIINKKQNQLDNILNSNRKQKETNEINFDMISVT